jgi:hypothetical protein
MRIRILLCLGLLAALPRAEAQGTTFTVTVALKTSDHPYNGQGWPEGYVIDGDQGAELTLTRGETYTFQMSGVSAIHPFYISTSSAGGDGGASAYSEGVTGNGASGNSTLTFAVPMDAPALLWYQCMSHVQMGWRINITNPVANEDEAQPLALALDPAYPNPFDDATRLHVTLPEGRSVSVVVYDEIGRRVRVLHDGPLPAGATPLDFRADDLSSGVYTVRATAGETVREQRVVLVR